MFDLIQDLKAQSLVSKELGSAVVGCLIIGPPRLKWHRAANFARKSPYAGRLRSWERMCKFEDQDGTVAF